MIFNVVPTALEVLLVSGILAYKCGPPLAGLALATLAAYTWFTFTMTAWRTQFRVRMNKMDAQASTRAIDALLNYETVRLPQHQRASAGATTVWPDMSVCMCGMHAGSDVWERGAGGAPV